MSCVFFVVTSTMIGVLLNSVTKPEFYFAVMGYKKITKRFLSRTSVCNNLDSSLFESVSLSLWEEKNNCCPRVTRY